MSVHQTVQANWGLVKFFRDRQRSVMQAELKARRRLKIRWFDLVRRSTWVSPRPSPRSMIIFNTKAPGQYEYGWIPYPGSQSRAEYRLQRRLVLFTEQSNKVYAQMLKDIEQAGGTRGGGQQ